MVDFKKRLGGKKSFAKLTDPVEIVGLGWGRSDWSGRDYSNGTANESTSVWLGLR
jgi:hypothetical protein